MRNKPDIIVQIDDHIFSHQIIKLKQLWAVFYNDDLITIKIINTFTQGTKYHNNIFQSEKTALNLANKLNKKYKTTAFNAKCLSK